VFETRKPRHRSSSIYVSLQLSSVSISHL
jgi:hypothetical protein